MASPNVQRRLAEGWGERHSLRADRRVPTTFRLRHGALNVFLVIRGQDGHTQMCSQMDSLGNDRWSLTLPLRPGHYRYRYYAIHERVTTYVSPKDVEDGRVRMSGIDAILVVPEKRAARRGTSNESEEHHDRPCH